MRTNPVKEKLQRGETVFGTMLRTFTAPEPCEILSRAGFDFLLIDGEHGPVT